MCSIYSLNQRLVSDHLHNRCSSQLPFIAGKDEVVGAPAAVEADLDLNTAPVPSRSPMVPGSVLSVLNFNEMNKRNVNRDTIIEEPLLRKGYGVKGAL